VPYNLARDIGGDTKRLDDLMDRCVRDVMASGKSKISAIAICKASIQKSERKKKK